MSSTRSGEGAARADEVAEGVELPGRLTENLRTRVEVVRPAVAFEVELVGPEGAAFLGEPLGFLLNTLQVAPRHLPRTARGRGITHARSVD